MRKWKETLERMFAAVSFAEAGEYETAQSLAGIQPNRAGKLSHAFEKTFVAAAFAEAGCPETSLNLLGENPSRIATRPLDAFLENVGLRGVPVRYGFAAIG